MRIRECALECKQRRRSARTMEVPVVRKGKRRRGRVVRGVRSGSPQTDRGSHRAARRCLAKCASVEDGNEGGAAAAEASYGIVGVSLRGEYVYYI